MVGMSLYEGACDIKAEWIEKYNDIHPQEAWGKLALYQYTTEKRPTLFPLSRGTKNGDLTHPEPIPEIDLLRACFKRSITKKR